VDTVGEGELLWNLVLAEGTDNEAIARGMESIIEKRECGISTRK